MICCIWTISSCLNSFSLEDYIFYDSLVQIYFPLAQTLKFQNFACTYFHSCDISFRRTKRSLCQISAWTLSFLLYFVQANDTRTKLSLHQISRLASPSNIGPRPSVSNKKTAFDQDCY